VLDKNVLATETEIACGLGVEGLRRIMKNSPQEAARRFTRIMTELYLVIIRCARFAMKNSSAGLPPGVTKNTDCGVCNMVLRAKWPKGRFRLVSSGRNGTHAFADLPAAGIGEGRVQ
jgi:hypothetical protein